MFSDLKNIIFRNWNFMRAVRMALALFILVEAVVNYDVMFGVVGFVLLLQSVFNVGCCSSGACYTGKVHDVPNDSQEISFEEIKNK